MSIAYVPTFPLPNAASLSPSLGEAAGIYVQGLTDTLTTPQSNALSNDEVRGGISNFLWKDFENPEGGSDFTDLSDCLDNLVSRDKLLMIRVGAGLDGTPPWLTNLPTDTPPGKWCPMMYWTGGGDPSIRRIPVFWSNEFKFYWSRFLTQLAQSVPATTAGNTLSYALHPNVAGIMMAGYNDDDGEMASPSNLTEIESFQRQGYSGDLYLRNIMWHIDLYARLFPRKIILLQGRPFTTSSAVQSAYPHEYQRIDLLQSAWDYAMWKYGTQFVSRNPTWYQTINWADATSTDRQEKWAWMIASRTTSMAAWCRVSIDEDHADDIFKVSDSFDRWARLGGQFIEQRAADLNDEFLRDNGMLRFIDGGETDAEMPSGWDNVISALVDRISLITS